MKSYKGYLIDLDGTMYRGGEKVEAASEFIERLANRGIPYLFVTNNSSKTPEQIAGKLESLGIRASSGQVFTSSMATAEYLSASDQPGKIYAIGEEGLFQALKDKGFELTDDHPDAVVMGIDRAITYEKLAKACLAVRNGARFIATNGDTAVPTERGLVPGNGALSAVIAVSTRVQPLIIGKPERIIMDQALKVLGVDKQAAIMVGDNYDTDIMAGIQSGIDTLHVQTGVTSMKELAEKREQPTYSVATLDEWEL